MTEEHIATIAIGVWLLLVAWYYYMKTMCRWWASQDHGVPFRYVKFADESRIIIDARDGTVLEDEIP